MTDLLTGLGVIVAGLAALVAARSARQTIAHANLAQRSAELANSHARHSNVIDSNAWIDDYLCNVRRWADEACENIARATHAVNLPPEERSRELYEAMYRISSLIDRGRWFFPNEWSEEYGVGKEPAYRGLRQQILNRLVAAYNHMQNLLKSDSKSSMEGLLHCQRLFVSDVQHVLNPRRRTEEIRRIDAEFAISERLAAREEKDGEPSARASKSPAKG